MSAICGIIGEHARRPAAQAELAAMLDRLQHRGPDDVATWRDADGPALLGFRWLRTQPGEQNPGVSAAAGSGLAMVCDGHVFQDDGTQNATPLLERFAARGPDG